MLFIPSLVVAGIARISELLDPFGPTAAHPKRKCPSAAETNSDHQDSQQ
jgi:hypothetical protein